MSKPRSFFPCLTALFLVLFCLVCGNSCSEEEARFPLIGEWAFNYAPETAVLRIGEDGTAFYEGQNWTWEWDASVPVLMLTNPEGEKKEIRYASDEKGNRIYLPGEYTRKDKLVDEEIWGVWTLEGSDRSSFVFEKDGRFMEDSTFVGSYTIDPEANSLLLQYQPAGYFDDTLCYFQRDGDHMTLFYPWPLTVAAQQAAH